MAADKPSKSLDTRKMEQVDKIAEMRVEQAAGKLPMVEANRDPNFQIKEIEADGYVHVFTRKLHNNPDTKSYDKEDRIVIIHKAEFDAKLKQNFFQLYDEAHVIHDPRDGDTPELKTNSANASTTPLADKLLSTPNAKMRERQEQLSQKEKDLAAKEAELAEREAKLNASTNAVLGTNVGNYKDPDAQASTDDQLIAQTGTGPLPKKK